MSNIKLGIAGLNKEQLLIFTSNIIRRMEDNDNFATPIPALADVEAKGVEYRDLIIKAVEGTKEDRSARDVAGQELRQMLRTLANYVAMTANGDRTTILSSGFDVRNEAEPVEPVTVPESLKALRSDIMGTVDLDWAVVPNAMTYQVMMTTTDPADPAAEWTEVALTSKSKATVALLTPGQYYWFRVKAVGRTSVSGYSDPAMVMAA